jgi:hypothetical protein
MNSYQTKIDGNIIDISPKQSITLERFNPIFDFGVVRGNKVNDYTVPLTPKNNKIFGYFNNRQVKYHNRSFLCEKIADGIIIEKGFVEIQDLTPDGYVIYYTQSLGDLFGDFQTTLMTQIDFGVEPIPSPIPLAYNYTTDKYCFPSIKNAAFYGTNELEGFTGYTNYTERSPVGPIVPMMGFPFVFSKIAEKCNVEFKGSFFQSDWYKFGVMENLFSLDGQTEIRYQNHFWEMTIPDFIKELGILLNLSLFCNTINRVITIHLTDELMNQPTTWDLTEKIDPAINRKVLKENRLEFDWEVDSSDNLMKVRPLEFQKYTSPTNGSGTLFKLTSKISTRTTDPGDGVAYAEQIGISTRFNQLTSQSSPKMLLWNGVTSGYQFATNQRGDLKLALHGEKNLIKSQYSTYESWRRKTVGRTIKANLTALDLQKLNFHQQEGENLSFYAHGKSYWIENLRVNLPLTGATTLTVWER